LVFAPNVVPHDEGGTQAEGVREEGSEEDIWAEYGGNRGPEETT
jgi:hypothetical protein